VEDNFWNASHDLSDLEHRLRDVVTNVLHGKRFYTHVEQHIDRLSIGNDLLDGGDGNDLLVGDNWGHFAPSVTVIADGLFPRNHHDDHDQNDNGHSHSHDDRRQDDVVGGNDTLNGGAGNDLMFGDSAVFLASTVAVSGQCDFPNALHQAQDLADDLLGVNHKGWSHEDDDDPASGGDDLLNGDDGDDILFGQSGDDILRGGPGNDWLVGNHDKDILDDSLGQNQKHQGENESKALREAVANRLVEFGLFNGSSLTIKFKLPRIFAK